jgi:hypothetical protein
MTDPTKIPVEPETDQPTEHGNNKGHKWKPGESGNPAGRPKKGYSITEAFKSMFEAEPNTKAQVVDVIKQKALQGDTAALKMVWEYMDGKPTQGVEVSGKDGGPIDANLTVTFIKPDGQRPVS